MRFGLYFLLLISISIIQCKSQVKSEMQKKPIDQVFKEQQDTLLAVKGVQGFYQSITDKGDSCIVIMVDKLTEELKSRLPDSLEGYPVILEETGVIRPLKNDEKKPSP